MREARVADPPARGPGDLAPRVATILVGAPVLIGALWVGSGPLLLVVLGLVAVGTLEFRRLAVAAGHHPSGVVSVGALVFPVLAATDRWAGSGPAAVVVAIAAAAAALVANRRAGAPGAAAVDTLGALYVGALLAHVVLLRAEAGFAVSLTVLGVIWTNDIAAYGVGHRWGRRKLAPAISPGKSVEGFAGGVGAAVVVAVATAAWQGWPAFAWGTLGLCVAVAGVAGDLFKSTMKRAAGVKDSGALFPGHGGVLDRFDAVLFGVPIGYYLWRWFL
jgi:phosphatidate cytidylyltransferase